MHNLIHGCKPVAEGSIVGYHEGFRVLDAIMDDQDHTNRINVLVPGAIHSLHKQTIEWIFIHGGKAVVTTSQLRTHGETAPISSGTINHTFTTPVPPDPSHDDAEFLVSIPPSDPIQFEHWNKSTDYDSEDDSTSEGEEDDDLEFEGIDKHSWMPFEAEQGDKKCDNGHTEMHTYVPSSLVPTLQIFYNLPGFMVEPTLQDDNKCDYGHVDMHTYPSLLNNNECDDGQTKVRNYEVTSGWSDEAWAVILGSQEISGMSPIIGVNGDDHDNADQSNSRVIAGRRPVLLGQDHNERGVATTPRKCFTFGWWWFRRGISTAEGTTETVGMLMAMLVGNEAHSPTVIIDSGRRIETAITLVNKV
ncbi:hypothetical protein B0H17DRAFT_1135343 [Mycena rosella]|uniref:Uncharacterized protein n=1 Tax=Mycena rosella TaxID=1033263 RepID=A0AAD7DDH1_MYCRO|nr:hypothetical protein B0H17DRAFT_1135343 [Mycena rosella]